VLRSPNWSRDGQTVIYEKLGFKPLIQNRPLNSWDPEWEYRHTDVFPVLTPDGKLVITEKSMNSSIAIMDPDGSNRKRIFDAGSAGLDPTKVERGMAGAFNPTVSPDGKEIVYRV
jgi:Tol biopolymer transport system component